MSRGPLPIIALCAALALAVAGCGSDDSSTTGLSTGSGEGSEAAVSKDTSTRPNVTVPEGPPPAKLETVEIVEGSGPEAKAGDQVSVQYEGVNYKTGQKFDASWDRSEPLEFTLGVGEVIKGWDQGVAGMKVGGRRELIVPPALGYGSSGAPPAIPPNETLLFVVDLLAVK